MVDFVAIDFETANKDAASAISLAAVTVENGKITKRAYSLIKPPTDFFEPEFIDIHGITPKMVEDKPTFDVLWPAIYERHLKGKLIIAHNAKFDMGVLKGMLEHYRIEVPSMSYACTVKIARKVWPELVNHKLNTVGNFLGYEFNHHQALDDAQVCAQIAVAAARQEQVASMRELLEKLNLQTETFVGPTVDAQTSFF